MAKKGLPINLVLTLLVVICSAGDVRADLSSAPWSDGVQGYLGPAEQAATSWQDAPAAGNLDNTIWLSEAFTGSSPLDASTETEDQSQRQDVKQLPPAPDSAALFLCGLGSLGAWHLTRSARKLQFGHLPQWYHAGGPQQIGYAFALDLTFKVLPLWQPMAQPARQDTVFYSTDCPLQQRCNMRCFLTTAGPRGPPPLSS